MKKTKVLTYILLTVMILGSLCFERLIGWEIILFGDTEWFHTRPTQRLEAAYDKKERADALESIRGNQRENAPIQVSVNLGTNFEMISCSIERCPTGGPSYKIIGEIKNISGKAAAIEIKIIARNKDGVLVDFTERCISAIPSGGFEQFMIFMIDINNVTSFEIKTI